MSRKEKKEVDLKLVLPESLDFIEFIRFYLSIPLFDSDNANINYIKGEETVKISIDELVELLKSTNRPIINIDTNCKVAADIQQGDDKDVELSMRLTLLGDDAAKEIMIYQNGELVPVYDKNLYCLQLKVYPSGYYKYTLDIVDLLLKQFPDIGVHIGSPQPQRKDELPF